MDAIAAVLGCDDGPQRRGDPKANCKAPSLDPEDPRVLCKRRALIMIISFFTAAVIMISPSCMPFSMHMPPLVCVFLPFLPGFLAGACHGLTYAVGQGKAPASRDHARAH